MREKAGKAAWAFLKAVLIIAFSVGVGVGTNVALEWVHFGELARRFAPDLDSMMATLVADSFATSATVYLSLYFVQIQEIKAMISDEIFGREYLDIPRAALTQIMDDIPQFSQDNPRFPLVVCNELEAMRKYLKKIDASQVANIALAIARPKACAGNAITEGFGELRKLFGAKRFGHVLLVRNTGSGFVVDGYLSAASMFELLSPKLQEGKFDENVASAMAALAEFDNPGAFKTFNFITEQVPETTNTRTMIRSLVKTQSNDALVTNRGAVSHHATLWRLIRAADS